MAFTGYVFESKTEVEPLAERADDADGATFKFCREAAIRLNAFIAAGYPEQGNVAKGDPPGSLFNSMCFLSRSGDLLRTYRKHFLYETDKVWANEGPSFDVLDVQGLGRVGFGICMDLNPWEFKAPFDKFEFASFHVGSGTDLVICPCNWLATKGDEVDESDGPDRGTRGETDRVDSRGDAAGHSQRKQRDRDKASAMQTINYWALRMSPAIATPRQTVFVACNRTGDERGSTFAGSSCVLALGTQQHARVGEALERTDRPARLFGCLGTREEGILVASVPYAFPPGVGDGSSDVEIPK
jgi:protein N-terminal amidase